MMNIKVGTKVKLKSGIKIKVKEILEDGRYRLIDGDIVSKSEISEILSE